MVLLLLLLVLLPTAEGIGLDFFGGQYVWSRHVYPVKPADRAESARHAYAAQYGQFGEALINKERNKLTPCFCLGT